mmetsp:Transcript_67063/g.151609  ORF Transcript_67063/g.151609 Transcript_67063/m.151609 type:complete len:231 (-) Transcript_67063:1018-1710(-)
MRCRLGNSSGDCVSLRLHELVVDSAQEEVEEAGDAEALVVVPVRELRSVGEGEGDGRVEPEGLRVLTVRLPLLEAQPVPQVHPDPGSAVPAHAGRAADERVGRALVEGHSAGRAADAREHLVERPGEALKGRHRPRPRLGRLGQTFALPSPGAAALFLAPARRWPKAGGLAALGCPGALERRVQVDDGRVRHAAVLRRGAGEPERPAPRRPLAESLEGDLEPAEDRRDVP